MDKNNFLLYKDFKSTIDLLSDEQAGKLIKAVFSYVNGRVEPVFDDGMLVVAFNILKTQLERDLQKYKNIAERNQINGAKGGRPKNNPDEEDKPKKPSGLIGNPTKTQIPKKADSDSDSVRDSVSDRDKKDNIKPLSNWEKLFDKFWLDYPKKVNKGNAKKWFKQNKPDELLVNIMIEKVLEYIEKDVWNKENYQYIPYASSWLNAEGWTNEVIKVDKNNNQYKSEQQQQKDELLKFMTQKKHKEIN
jgi:hypothetical protein